MIFIFHMNLKGEKKMRLEDFENMPVQEALPLGTHSVIFNGLRYRTDKLDNVIGAFVEIEGYDNLYIPIREKDNYQFTFLRRQLGVKSYKASDFNAKAGTEIICSRYMSSDGQYTNTSFNPNPRENYDVEEFA